MPWTKIDKLRGTDGSAGVDGSAGAAASLSVGSVSTVSYGQPATVVNSGSSSTAVLNFGIPAGQPGSTGGAGTDGSPGNVWRSGPGAPSNATGINGDLYLNTTTSDVYQRASGAYSVIANIKGVTGAAGSAGSTGAAGADGKTVRNGTGAPSSGLGAAGDFYIDTAASAIYGPKVGSVWGSATNLVGATGATGSVGSAGTAASVAVGTVTGLAAGATPTVTNSGSSSAATLNFGIPAGATGSTGAAGTAGTVWRNGSGAPSNGTGVDGDYYLNTANGDVYKRASGTYSVAGNIKGATGASGATLVGTVSLGQTAAIAITAGIREVTVALTGAAVANKYVAFAKSYTLNGGSSVNGRPPGYALIDCVCNTTNQITVSLNAPLLAIGAAYNITADVVQVNA